MKCLSLIIITLPARANVQTANEEKVMVNLVASQGVGRAIDTVTITETVEGLEFTLDPKTLPLGEYDFHVHMSGNCQPAIKEGKVSAAGLAGGHYDLHQTGKHEGPEDADHMGDLPLLVVNNDGNATAPVVAPRLKTIDEVKDRALVIRVGDDNMPDQPKPLGGGGARYAYGATKQSTAESTRQRRLFEL